ncbi:MAG: LysE family translocator [Actinocrinis sp.]
MIPTEHILPFLLTAVIIILVPGPQVLFVVGRALAYGRRTAVTTAAGGTLGAYTQSLLVSLGLGAIVERSDLVYSGLKLVGAAYLVFLGVNAFRHRNALHEGMQPDAFEQQSERDGDNAGDGAGSARTRSHGHVSGLRAARQGMLVGLTNPKVAIFFGAILPQFVDRARGHVPLQMMIFATMFSMIALLCDSSWGLVAGTARDWFAKSPKRLSAVGGAGGLAMVGLGVGIAVSGRGE